MEKRANKKSNQPALYCQKEETKALHELLGKIGDKWSILVIVVLSRSPGSRARFSALRKEIDGISQRMLTSTLRNLERDGFLMREVFPEVPPRVEYELSALGKSLLLPMQHMVEWSLQNWKEIRQSQESYDRKNLSTT